MWGLRSRTRVRWPQFALRRNKRGVASATLDAMLAAYRLGDVKAEHASDEDVRLFEATAAALWALGAVAARAGDWALVRAIVAAEPADGGYYDSWLRHGQVMSARRATDSEDDNALNMPERQLALHPGYGMTEGGPDQRLLALCVFDQLALLVVASGLEPGERVNYYPSYAKYPAEYVEGTVIELRTEGPMRTAIFPGSNEHLREVLRDTNEMAVLQAAQFRDQGRDWSYRGYLDPRTWVFIRDGQMWESWRAIRG
jgi:hypothetical protein